jgi:hypothetical protein
MARGWLHWRSSEAPEIPEGHRGGLQGRHQAPRRRPHQVHAWCVPRWRASSGDAGSSPDYRMEQRQAQPRCQYGQKHIHQGSKCLPEVSTSRRRRSRRGHRRSRSHGNGETPSCPSLHWTFKSSDCPSCFASSFFSSCVSKPTTALSSPLSLFFALFSVWCR